MGLVTWFLLGLVAAYLARMIVRPGTDMGCVVTGLTGMAGSLVGGTLGNLLTDGGIDLTRASFVGSLVGSCIILGIVKIAS